MKKITYLCLTILSANLVPNLCKAAQTDKQWYIMDFSLGSKEIIFFITPTALDQVKDKDDLKKLSINTIEPQESAGIFSWNGTEATNPYSAWVHNQKDFFPYSEEHINNFVNTEEWSEDLRLLGDKSAPFKKEFDNIKAAWGIEDRKIRIKDVSKLYTEDDDTDNDDNGGDTENEDQNDGTGGNKNNNPDNGNGSGNGEDTENGGKNDDTTGKNNNNGDDKTPTDSSGTIILVGVIGLIVVTLTASFYYNKDKRKKTTKKA